MDRLRKELLRLDQDPVAQVLRFNRVSRQTPELIEECRLEGLRITMQKPVWTFGGEMKKERWVEEDGKL